MSVGDNADWGLTFETHACERLDLEFVANDGGEHQGVDAIATRAVRARTLGDTIQPSYLFSDKVTNGDRVACKVARYRISDGDTTRCGRYWIPRCELERVDGYALGVYHEESGVLEDAVTIVPSEDIEGLVTSWVDSPRHDVETVARIPWSRVFDRQEVDPDD